VSLRERAFVSVFVFVRLSVCVLVCLVCLVCWCVGVLVCWCVGCALWRVSKGCAVCCGT
jgi:hypothetical protein